MFKLTEQDVERIVADLWSKRIQIAHKVWPHLRMHFPDKTIGDIVQTLKSFLNTFKDSFEAGEIDDSFSVETGRLKFELGVEEEGIGWYYNFGFTEREENYLWDDVMTILRRKEW